MPKNNTMLLAAYNDSGMADKVLMEARSANLRAFTDVGDLRQDDPEYAEISRAFSLFSAAHRQTAAVVAVLAPTGNSTILDSIINKYQPDAHDLV